MVSEREVTIKATPYRIVRSFLDENLSEESRDRVLAKVSAEFPAQAALLRQRVVVATERLPVVLLNRMVELAAEELHQPAELVGNTIGRRSAKESSSGVLRLAMVMISMPSLLRKLAPVWTQMYSHGKMSSQSEGRSAVIELTDYPVVSASGCARITGTFEWFAEQAEKTATIRHTTCRAKGGSICRWDMQW